MDISNKLHWNWKQLVTIQDAITILKTLSPFTEHLEDFIKYKPSPKSRRRKFLNFYQISKLISALFTLRIYLMVHHGKGWTIVNKNEYNTPIDSEHTLSVWHNELLDFVAIPVMLHRLITSDEYQQLLQRADYVRLKLYPYDGEWVEVDNKTPYLRFLQTIKGKLYIRRSKKQPKHIVEDFTNLIKSFGFRVGKRGDTLYFHSFVKVPRQKRMASL